MEYWMIYILISLIAITLEVFIPSLFCINFAFAGILTAIISIFWGTTLPLLWTFLVISIISIIFIKPLLERTLKKDSKSDFEAQYIGKIVKCIEPVTMTKGAVSIYDERWEARLALDSEEIPAGSDVKIINHDSLILFVEKV